MTPEFFESNAAVPTPHTRRKIAGKLLAWKEDRGGVRQVGKTCSVTEFISQNYRHHIPIDL